VDARFGLASLRRDCAEIRPAAELRRWNCQGMCKMGKRSNSQHASTTD
jgi:hypothetical protein